MNTNSTFPTAFEGTLNYVDGHGNRTSQRIVFFNDAGIDEAAFLEFVDEHIGSDLIVAAQWGLPNLSPVEYDWDAAGPVDHAYLQLDNLTAVMDIDQEMFQVSLQALLGFAEEGGTPAYLEAAERFRAVEAQEKIRTTVLTLEQEMNPHPTLIESAQAFLRRHGYQVTPPKSA